MTPAGSRGQEIEPSRSAQSRNAVAFSTLLMPPSSFRPRALRRWLTTPGSPQAPARRRTPRRTDPAAPVAASPNIDIPLALGITAAGPSVVAVRPISHPADLRISGVEALRDFPSAQPLATAFN